MLLLLPKSRLAKPRDFNRDTELSVSKSYNLRCLEVKIIGGKDQLCGKQLRREQPTKLDHVLFRPTALLFRA